MFVKYDTDRSGFLDKRETLKLLNEFMKNQGKRPTTMQMFNAFYADFDQNGDGLISKNEMLHLVEKFISIPTMQFCDILDMVNRIWYNFDTDRSGKLNRKETLKFLNHFMAE